MAKLLISVQIVGCKFNLEICIFKGEKPIMNMLGVITSCGWAFRQEADTFSFRFVFELLQDDRGTGEVSRLSSSFPNSPCQGSLDWCGFFGDVVSIETESSL